MKKFQELFSYIFALFILGSYGYFGQVMPFFDISNIIIYVSCLIICPLLALIQFSGFIKTLFSIIFAILACGGILVCSTFLNMVGIWSSLPLLLTALILGTHFIIQHCQNYSAETTHFLTRGLPYKTAFMKTNARNQFAYFFLNSGKLAAFIAFWNHLSTNNFSDSAIFGAALFVVLMGLLGFVLYNILGAPEKDCVFPFYSRGRLICIYVVLFILLLSFLYIYIGYRYIPQEILTAQTIKTVQDILTPALIAAFFGLLLGTLCGFIANFLCNRFFNMLFRFIRVLPFFSLPTLLVLFAQDFYFLLMITTALYTIQFILERCHFICTQNKLPIAKFGRKIVMPFLFVPYLIWIVSAVFYCVILSIFNKYNTSLVSTPFIASVLFVCTILFYTLYRLLKGVDHYA